MFTGKIEIDSQEFILNPGHYDTNRKDIELDDGGFIINNVSATDMLKFTADKEIDYIVTDGVTPEKKRIRQKKSVD
jgi:hypothetical protein